MVKQGYKQTEIGVIPEDWMVDTIGSITLSVATGGNYKNSIQRSPYPLIKMGNLSRGHINLHKIEYVIDSIPFEKDRLAYGDVLFNTRNTPELVGKVAVWKNELPIAYFNSNLLRFNFNLEKSNPFFMNLIFNTEQVISEFKNIAKGTTSVAAIYPQDMLKVKIKIPPIQEQKRIAEALSDVDSMISSLEKLIAKKKAIKQGVMQELLTGKKRLHGFTGEWKIYFLSQLGIFIKGSGISRDESNSGTILAVRYGELYTKHNNYITKFYSHISEEVANNAKRIYYGDILFAASGETKEEIGKCAAIVSNEEVYAGGDILIFRPLNALNPLFMGTILNMPEAQKQRAEKGQGDAIVHIHADDLGKLSVQIPEFEEQTAIASVLSDMDNEIEALEQKLAKTRQIKQGMMQQLLTGKIRLV